MEGSAFSYRLFLPVGLLLALAIYVTYNGNIMTYFEYGHSNAVILNEENSEEPMIDQNRSENILRCKVEKGNTKFPINVCTNWFASSKKLEVEDYFCDTEELYEKSTCSISAAGRGPNQQVVSFSFYGDINHHRGYFKGVEANAILLKKYYPNWIMRLYHDIPPMESNQLSNNTITTCGKRPPFHNDSNNEESSAKVQKGDVTSNESVQEILCQLMCAHSNLDLCYAGNIPGFGNLLGGQGNMWRFLPMADPLVDVFISRDLDSHPSERELAAVNEWLKSNLTYHIMRDHPYHSNPILAGMWGAALYTKREELFNLTVIMMIKGIKAKSKGLDQSVLHEVIWPAAKGSLMQHDSYFCKEYGKDHKVYPWPTRRNIDEPYNFVGARMGVDVVPMKRICPVECRPPNKGHWVHC